MEITPDNLRRLRTSFIGDWRKAYEGTPTFWQQIAMRVPSSTSQNDYGWMATIPEVQEWIGPRVIHDLSAHEYTLKNKPYELTLGVKRDDIKDDNLGIYSTRAQAHGQAFARHPDNLIKSVLEGNPDCFDGQPFFDGDHPIDANDTAKGTYSNLFTSKALTQANFLAVRAAMTEYVGEEGRNLGILPRLLVVPAALEGTAIEICKNERDAAGASNTTRNMADYLVIPGLSSSTTWYLMDVSRLIMPFIFQERESPLIVAKESDSDTEVLVDGQYRLYGSMRGNAGVSLPFLASKCTA